MALPLHALDKSKEADNVIQLLKVIKQEAEAAKGFANIDITNLYYAIVKASATFSALADKGLTIEVLGPVLGDKLSIDWTLYKADFEALKDVAGPAYTGFVFTNQEEILKQELTNSKVMAVSISEETKTSILPLINAVADLLEL